ncbi:H+ Antiporter protein [Calidithermus terrae]|uniref:H+ Antiporter protein n=1 Tax=Calidithermus terrae TaxID=1408545 RepID=A0A399EVP0_9DEIN|nr:MFS transporter [Calidithermus terrae]RIH87733.1 H+ Antiporter protein [Calidithermus terrae]
MLRLGSQEPLRSLRLSVWEGTLAILFINWSSGVVVTGYALWLGASPAALAVLGAIPLLGQLAAPFALMFKGQRKPYTMLLAGSGRAVFGLVLLAPLLPPEARVPAFLLVAALSQVVIAPVNVLWTSWMADLVPPRERGRYFGFRNAVLGLVGTLGNLSAGLFIDAVPKPWGFLIVLGLGVVLGVAASQVLRWQHEPPHESSSAAGSLRVALTDRAFLGFLGFLAFWWFAVLVGGPFAFPLFLEYARLNFTEVGLWTVISASCGLVFGPLWGRFADRYGHGLVLIWTGLVGSVVLPGLWLLGGPGHTLPIWLSAVADALCWSGLGAAQTNVALQQAPPAHRGAYLAVFGIVVGVFGMLGSALGGALGSLNVGPSPYHLPILASIVLRTMAVGYLFWARRV